MVVLLGTSCGSGDSPDEASPPTTERSSVAASDSTTTIVASCDTGESNAASGDELMLSLLCERRAAVDDLELELGVPGPTLEGASAIREQACSASFVRPTRDQIEVQHGLYIRGTAQQDDDTARRWLAAGILDVYERTDNGDGTFVLNVEFNLEVIARLADADERLLDAIDEQRGELCS